MTNMTSKIIAAFVIICYLSLGIWLATSQTSIFTIPLQQQKILGYVFIVFAIIRSIMFYTKMKKYKLKKSHKDDQK